MWFFRAPVLRSAGNFLISEDKIVQADVIFVLGGDALSRAGKAALLLSQGVSEKIICTGAYISPVLQVLDIEMTESDLTRTNLIKSGIDSSRIEEFKRCMSTMDEALFFLEYCRKNKIQSAIIVTGTFHTRRVNYIFDKVFRNSGVHLMVTGVESKIYSEDDWWRSEEGLIALNNEYVKLFYYWIKY